MTRIISGSARGRELAIPPAGTRPTADRAREGLFSSIAARFPLIDARVLDLYAGSGALGLEAASRGARRVDLVEANRDACDIITRNTQVVPDVPVHVHQASALDFVERLSDQTFDLVLADPPYAVDNQEVEMLLERIRPYLASGAGVVVERRADSAPFVWPEGFEPTTQKLKKRTFGIARMDMAYFYPGE
ncbi:RsmD family RNA methyltransferase [Corynebacterium tapiri]|uniref:Methyltransferase n=1 Tax=Corynebacterium tapiri TaxID=1448266 RepID=A0A5C4U5Y7_9CORY|nr:RsmD family RNA methyltransferase [Corynebacterium tapiri]TNL99820.1 methyltransferase [Corynebacterium tapiri]